MIYVMLSGMDKKNAPPDPQSRFAEVIRKSREKRAEMNSNSAHRAEQAVAEANAEAESPTNPESTPDKEPLH